MKTTKKIILADDHAVVRAGIASVINKYTPCSIVAEAADGIEAIEKVRQHKPDLVVMDIGMPGLNGLEAIIQIKKISPATGVLVLSVHCDRDFVTMAIRNGASGYLIKDGAIDELIKAIETILGGNNYISSALSDIMTAEIVSPSINPNVSALDKLSLRERQIISLIAEGASKSTIAGKLHISPETVKTHRKNMMRKLKIANSRDLVKFASENLVGPIVEPPTKPPASKKTAKG